MKKPLLFTVFSLTLICFSTNGQANKPADWRMTFDISSIGTLETVFTFKFEDSTFQAYSKGEQASDIIGFWRYSMARIFTDNFKNGSIAYISNGELLQNAKGASLKGILKTPMGNRYFRGNLRSQHISGYLLNSNEDTVGHVKGKPFQKSLPLRDYPALTKNTLDTVQQYLYDPGKLRTDAWEDFESDLTEVAHELADDLGMLLAFSYLSRDLPFSHLGLTRTSSGEDEPMIRKSQFSDAVHLKPLSDSTVQMTIYSFGGSAEEIHKAFQQVKAGSYQNLIVDLRTNSGGAVDAGLAFIRHLMKEERYGGVFLTRKYFRNHDSIPTATAYQDFPTLKEGNYQTLIDGIHTYQGMSLKIDPVKEPFRGDVYVLTSRRTASTCEPLVYGLKQNNRATIVGGKTAGAMLSAEAFQLPHQYQVFLPTASYYTADGYQIDQQGVKPDHEVSQEKALNYVLEELIPSSRKSEQ